MYMRLAVLHKPRLFFTHVLLFPLQTNYLFMGDFVDRGFYSVETFLLLLALKVRKGQLEIMASPCSLQPPQLPAVCVLGWLHCITFHPGSWACSRQLQTQRGPSSLPVDLVLF